MNYISTRNNSKKVSFEHVFLKGLSEDGGLFIPDKLKKFDHKELEDLSNLNYKNLAFNIIKLFTGEFISELELKNLVNKSYENFRDSNVVKINKINKQPNRPPEISFEPPELKKQCSSSGSGS